MSDKIFTTVDTQIDILKSRGLKIADESVAKDFLLRNNYYRISGYSLTLRSHDKFFRGTTFQNIIDIYEFDHVLRHILLKYIENIEVTIKSIYSYEFTKIYGATGYLNSTHFSDAKEYARIIAKAEEQKNKRHPHEAYLKHFMDEVKQDIPLWAYVDLLTISDISHLYSITEERIKIAVANSLGITHNKGPQLIGKFMHSMTIIRNLCAHGSRIYNRLFEQKPSISKNERLLLRTRPDGSKDNAHLFGFILIMRRLLSANDFAQMKIDMISIKNKYSFVDMKYYGFCDNWEILL